MASVMTNGLDINLKGFLKVIRDRMQEEEASSSKLKTFNRLMRRISGNSTFVENKFEFSMEHILQNKKLYINSIIFVKDIPWSIHLEPANAKLTSNDMVSYDVVIKCYFPNVVYQDDSEILANIRFSGPSPISSIAKTQNFRRSQKIFVLPDCITYNKLKNAKKNKQKMFEFSVAIEIKTDKRKKHITKLPINWAYHPGPGGMSYDDQFEILKSSMGSEEASSSCKPATKEEDAISALYNVLSEETMKLCTGEDWFRMLDFVTCMVTKYYWKNSVPQGKEGRELQQYMCRTGITDHLITLLSADFSQGKFSHLLPELLVKLVVWRAERSEGTSELKQLARMTCVGQALLSQIRSRRSNIKLVSRLVLSVFPAVYSGGKNRLTNFAQLLADLNVYYNTKNLVPLALKMDDVKLVDYYRCNQITEDAYEEALIFYHKMVLAVIAEGRLQALPIGTSKMFLRTVAENKINPYFDSGSQAFTFYNITRLIKKYGDSELYKYWLSWLKDNSSCNPLLFDLVPAEVSHEVPFTSDCGCFDFGSLDIPKIMPIYHKIYASYYDVVTSPLKNAIYNKDITYTIVDIERTKNQGNTFHKNREFQLAITEYDKAIDQLMVRKLRCREFEEKDEHMFNTENLLTVCRSNRVSSNLELGRHIDATVDATLVLRELTGMLEGNEQNYWEYVEEREEEMLAKRLTAARFKRVKALIALKQWGPALQNILQVIRHDQFRDVAMGHYYNCLAMYIKESKNLQYPHHCIVCCNAEEMDADAKYHQLEKRCKNCRHPYCSKDCQIKDKSHHDKYCAVLTKYYKKHCEEKRGIRGLQNGHKVRIDGQDLD